MKESFKNAVANIRAGINDTPSKLVHLPLVMAAVFAGIYTQSENPVAGLAAGYMVFAALRGYHYEGRELKNAGPSL